MDILDEYVILIIFSILDDKNKWNLALSAKKFFNIFRNSIKLLKEFTLKIDRKNFKNICDGKSFYDVPFINVSISFDDSMNIKKVSNFLSRYGSSIEKLELDNFEFKNFRQCFHIFNRLKKLKSLKLNNCRIEIMKNETLAPIKTFASLTFNKCNDNIFKIFANQRYIEKIAVSNGDWTWNGFPHDVFNEICRNNKNLQHLTLKGAGTGSYFDCDDFPYLIKILDTSMITFHWYVGIRTARINFLESQKGFLKELRIHQLPYDFDGERVLKYIIEEMSLENFYYGDIPLILNGEKQEVKEFEVSEIQITSAFEMVRQFPSIDKITLRISKSDIASDAVESVINPRTDLFKNIKEFELIDESGYRGLFGVFLGLFKNLSHVERLKFNTQDRNINVILEVCLPEMINLKEIHLTSTASRVLERFTVIKNRVPNIEKLTIASQFVDEANKFFDNRVIICAI